jgi:hypothetical protein
MPDKSKDAAKKSDDGAKEKKKGELDLNDLDNVSGGYAPGRNQKKKSDPQHHRENR